MFSASPSWPPSVGLSNLIRPGPTGLNSYRTEFVLCLKVKTPIAKEEDTKVQSEACVGRMFKSNWVGRCFSSSRGPRCLFQSDRVVSCELSRDRETLAQEVTLRARDLPEAFHALTCSAGC